MPLRDYVGGFGRLARDIGTIAGGGLDNLDKSIRKVSAYNANDRAVDDYWRQREAEDAIAATLKNAPIDFDDPEDIRQMTAQLAVIDPEKALSWGQSALNAVIARRTERANAQRYQSLADKYNAESGLTEAKTGLYNWGSNLLKDQYAAGEVPSDIVWDYSLNHPGKSPLSIADQTAIEAAKNKTELEKQKLVNAGKLAVAGKKSSGKKSSTGGAWQGKPLKEAEVQEILHLGVPIVKQMYPDLEINPDEPLDDSINLAIRQAYSTGLALAQKSGNPFMTKADIIYAGLKYLKDNNKMGVAEKVIPGQPATWLRSATPEERIKELKYPLLSQQPPKAAPPENQQPDNSNYPSVFNQPSADKVVTETVELIKKNPNITKRQIVLQMMARYKAMGLSKEETKARINAFINQRQ